MPLTSTTAAPPQPTWDPLPAPYTAWEFRGGRHEPCPNGLLSYPPGTDGEGVAIFCACMQPGCACPARAVEGAR